MPQSEEEQQAATGVATSEMLNTIQREMATSDHDIVDDAMVKREREEEEGTTVAVMAMNASGLPVARVKIKDRELKIKVDTGAACSIAGIEWASYGEQLPGVPQVRAVVGLGGQETNVKGLNRFQVQLKDGQYLTVDSLVVDGYGDEFLLGSDFARAHHAIMDYRSGRLTLDIGEGMVVLPFRCENDDEDNEISVRLVSKVKMNAETYVHATVRVEAPGGHVRADPERHGQRLVGTDDSPSSGTESGDPGAQLDWLADVLTRASSFRYLDTHG